VTLGYCDAQITDSHPTFIAHRAQFLNLTLTTSFGNGTTIPDGEYRVLLRALRIFGNPSEQNDWETYQSPIFVKASAAS